jgi:hypothetical protein
VARKESADAYLEDVARQFRKYRELADRALAQVADEDFFRTPDPESNSVAIVMKHLSGNMRSRWRNFLATDGEKADRNRDAEFVVAPGETRQSVVAAWDAGWTMLFAAIGPLQAEDLGRTVRIRGEAHTVMQAIQRQLTHYAYHVGQIVFLAKHFAGSRWKSLSIPKGRSKDFEVSKDGEPYVPGRNPA